MSKPTETLVESASRHDSGAIDELLGRFLPELHAFLRLRMGNALSARESISDLAQSVCREVLEDLDDFDYRGEAPFRRWLFLHAQRKLVSRARFHNRDKRAATKERPLDDVMAAAGAATLLTPSRIVSAREEVDIFWRCVEQLPPEQREVLALCRGLGMTPSEAAGELGKTPNAVRVSLHRALAKLAVLQERMERDGGAR